MATLFIRDYAYESLMKHMAEIQKGMSVQESSHLVGKPVTIFLFLNKMDWLANTHVMKIKSTLHEN